MKRSGMPADGSRPLEVGGVARAAPNADNLVGVRRKPETKR